MIWRPPQHIGLLLPDLDHWEVLPLVCRTTVLLQLESLAFPSWSQSTSNCGPQSLLFTRSTLEPLWGRLG